MNNYFIIIVFFLMSTLHIQEVKGQIFETSERPLLNTKDGTYFIGLFKQSNDGTWNYKDYGNGCIMTSIDYFNYSRGNEHFFCYDKKNSNYYYYTDNVIGYYNITSQLSIHKIEKVLKENNVPKVSTEIIPEMLTEVANAMKELYNKKNDSIYEERRLAREQYIKDSIEVVKRRDLQKIEYRSNHKWNDLSMSKIYGLKCDFCNSTHYMKDYWVLSINADTLFYLLDKPEMSHLGITHTGIHYSTLTTDFKIDYQFKNYVDIWQDSIANNNKLSKQTAIVVNLIQYNEFKDKIHSAAPYGFIQDYGWELNTAQGIEPFFSFFNSSKKVIKYVDLYYSIFNAVGDKCFLKFGRSYIGNIRGVGPVEPFDVGSWKWERATDYTSADASQMKIVKLVITYMDGTVKTIPNSSIIYDN